MARPTEVKQPGPALLPRLLAVEGRGRGFDMPLKAGAPLLDAVRAGFAEAGFASGVIEIGALVGVPRIDSVSPSTSLSLPTTASVTGVLIAVVEVSGFASGASFTGFTVTATVEVAVFPAGSVTV